MAKTCYFCAVVCSGMSQDCSVDRFEVLDPESEDHWGKAVEMVAKGMKLEPIGMIYTDLQDKGLSNGKVLCKRNMETFFVSGFQQLEHSSVCKFSSSGDFGSKWVNVVVNGDDQGDISFFPFMSNTAVAK